MNSTDVGIGLSAWLGAGACALALSPTSVSLLGGVISFCAAALGYLIKPFAEGWAAEWKERRQKRLALKRRKQLERVRSLNKKVSDQRSYITRLEHEISILKGRRK